MSVEFVSGKPGGGKTLYSVHLILRELADPRSRRVVVTNVSLRLDVLNEVLQKHYPDASVDLFARIKILDENELAEFFLYRGPERRVATVVGGRSDGLPNYSAMPWEDVGVFYVLDEVHIAFNARAWMKTGPGAIYYLSQHRKLGDDVIAITQSIGNVDKQFRSVAQSFHYLRNQAKERYKGFAMPRRFQRKSYLQPVTPGGTDDAFEVQTFALPLHVASCYNTAAGVGIVGKGSADVGQVAKGIPYYFAIIPLLAIAAAIYFVPMLVGRGLVAATDIPVKPSVPAAAAPVHGNGGVPAVRPSSALASRNPFGAGSGGVRISPERLTGLVAFGPGDVLATLESGDEIPAGQVDRYSLERGWVESGGVRYYLLSVGEAQKRQEARRAPVAAAPVDLSAGKAP